MRDQLTVARVIDGLDGCDHLFQFRIVLLDVRSQLVLGRARTCDQNGAGIGDRLRHRMQEIMIAAGMPAADGACLVMNMLGRVVRMQHQLLDLGRAEMKYLCLAVIDPDDGVIMAHGD